MPCPNKWPHIDGYCAAEANLRDVIVAAINNITTSGAQQIYKDAIIKATACMGHPDSFLTVGPKSDATSVAKHFDRTDQARTKALNGQWPQCIIELDHAGGAGAPTGKATKPGSKKRKKKQKRA